MKNLFKKFAVLFSTVVGLSSCNPDPEITQPPAGSNVSTLEQALSAIQGTWYLDYREEIIYSCGNSTGTIKSTTVSDLSYPDFEFQFTQLPNTSIFGSSLSQYETSGAFTVNLEGGANSTSYFLYKVGNQGNVFNQLLGVSSNPEQLYIYMSFQFDDEMYVPGGFLTIHDENHMSIEVMNSNGAAGMAGPRRILHFTKNLSSYNGSTEIQSLKGDYISSFKEQFISNSLVQTTDMNPWNISITDTLISPINTSTGNQNFPGARSHWYIAHGLGEDWDGLLFTSTSSVYPIGFDNSGNLIGTEGELIMVKDGFITFSPDVLNYKCETLRIVSNTPSELVLRSYQGCNDYIDYHFTKVN
jgi:hypothetical protein